MKKLAILSAIALSGLIFNTASAQVRLHVGLNLGPVRVVYNQRPVISEQPVYQEPSPVYDDNNDDDYYYLPDVDAYYDVTAGCYYYNDGYSWISAAYLPGSYRNYDWRSARRFEIREHRPFMHNDVYRSRYNGRGVAEWRKGGNDNHYGNRGGYAMPEQNRDNDNHYGNRGNGGYGRGNGGYSQPGRNNGGYGQPNQNNGGYNRGNGGYSQPSQNNGGHDRGNGGYSQPSQNNGGHDRGNGGYSQPSQNNGGYDRGNGGYSQPGQNNGGHDRGNGGYSQPGQNNGGHDRGNGGYSQPSQNNGSRDRGNGGYSQPSQNSGGSGSHGRSGDQHFADNRPATMGMSHRQARF